MSGNTNTGFGTGGTDPMAQSQVPGGTPQMQQPQPAPWSGSTQQMQQPAPYTPPQQTAAQQGVQPWQQPAAGVQQQPTVSPTIGSGGNVIANGGGVNMPTNAVNPAPQMPTYNPYGGYLSHPLFGYGYGSIPTADQISALLTPENIAALQEYFPGLGTAFLQDPSAGMPGMDNQAPTPTPPPAAPQPTTPTWGSSGFSRSPTGVDPLHAIGGRAQQYNFYDNATGEQIRMGQLTPEQRQQFSQYTQNRGWNYGPTYGLNDPTFWMRANGYGGN